MQPRDQPLVVVKQVGRTTEVADVLVEALIAEMKENEIDVLIIDPFISTHEVDENDNNKIQQVANQFVRVADGANPKKTKSSNAGMPHPKTSMTYPIGRTIGKSICEHFQPSQPNGSAKTRYAIPVVVFAACVALRLTWPSSYLSETLGDRIRPASLSN